MKLRVTFSLMLVFLCVSLRASSPIPFFKNFSPSEYDAMSQNWSITQDDKGYIYAGNNSCLLRFNGKSWEKIHPFSDKKNAIIRSLYHDSEEGKTFIGGFREFGYFEYDEYGKMRYTSLYEAGSTNAEANDEIWYITRIGRQVFFIYFTAYYVYDLDTGELRRDEEPTAFYYSIGEHLYLAPNHGEARRYNGKSISYDIVPNDISKRIMKVFENPSSETLTGISANEGIYEIKEGKAKRIDKLGDSWGIANRAIQCEDGTIIVGFISSGVYAFNPYGEILWHISMDEGLIDNTVLALYEDNSGNVWCALDKGIAVIYKDGDSMLSLTRYGLGKTTVSLLAEEDLFVGSNAGLAKFRMDNKSLRLRKTNDYFNDTPIWSLHEEGGEVFVGENGNSYIFRNGVLDHLSNAPGGTVPKQLTLRDGTRVLIQGSFTSLYVYTEDNGQWHFSHTVEGFLRPTKNLEVDYLGNIWIEHMYQGIYKVALSDDSKHVKNETVFPQYGSHVCKMGGRVLFHGDNGFHYYDDRDGLMKPFDSLNDAIGEYKNCNRVIPAGNDRYWLVKKKDAILISFHYDEVELLDYVNFSYFNVNQTESFESVISLADDRFLFGVEDGFLIHDLRENGGFKSNEISLGISSISSFHDDSLHAIDINSDKIVIPNNSSLNVKLFINGDKYYNTDIKFKLSPYDFQERVMGNQMAASYHHLHAGNYTFKAWTESKRDDLFAEISIPVIVKPSVFASWPAITLYIILSLGLLYMAYLLIQRALERQRIRLESEKEKEIITLRNEQLEDAVFLKSKELATYSLIEARRNQVLRKLRRQISSIGFGKNGGMSKSDHDTLMSIINEGEFSEDNWAHFYNNFDLIHKSFFKTLTDKHPSLTPNDLRICAYLRMNLSTKELADVMGITIKGAEAAKYRIRKKMNVNTAIPLNEYLVRIDSPDI